MNENMSSEEEKEDGKYVKISSIHMCFLADVMIQSVSNNTEQETGII